MNGKANQMNAADMGPEFGAVNDIPSLLSDN